MIIIKNEWLKRSALALTPLVFGGLLLSSCDTLNKAQDVVDATQETVEDVITNTDDKLEEVSNIDLTATRRDSQIQFYHAWLADCVNDTTFTTESDAKTTLTRLAQQRIGDAVKDNAIITGFDPDSLIEELVWGPVVNVEPFQTGIGQTHFAASNLIYCVKSTSHGIVSYSIGISGTNMLSPFDWFKEDLNVETQEGWGDGGYVSKGAYDGYLTLSKMQDKGKSLLRCIVNDLDTTKRSVISVSGHSLGGTLTQTYTSFLEAKLRSFPHCYVQAWVYAGPTAGDSRFARDLVSQLDGYYAYNNELDLIPHAWETDSLNQLCSIYNNFPIHDRSRIQGTPAINGVIQYLKILSGGRYKIPGTPTTFNNGPISLSDKEWNNLNTDIADLWAVGYPPYPVVDSLTIHCSGTKVLQSEFNNLFYYFTEMGSQHTSAYVDEFIPTSVAPALKRYCPGASASFTKGNLGIIILQRFLDDAYGKIKLLPSSSCGCN